MKRGLAMGQRLPVGGRNAIPCLPVMQGRELERSVDVDGWIIDLYPVAEGDEVQADGCSLGVL